MYVPFALLTLLVACCVPRAFSGDQCFNTNQVQVVADAAGEEHLPCNSSASISNCCPRGWICLSNGLCKVYGDSDPNHGQTSLYTGFCTDPSWKNDTVCPRICNNNASRKHVWPSTGGPLFGLDSMTDQTLLVRHDIGDGVVGCGDGSFCCYGQGGPGCCKNLTHVFSLGVATYLNTATGPSLKTLELTIANPATTSTAAIASTSTNTSLRTSSTSTLVPTQRTSVISSASTLRSAVAASSTPPSPTPKAGVHKHVAVGVGIGVTVGLVIVGVSLYLLLGRSRKKSETGGQPAGVLYVDGKSEMEARANSKRNDGNHETVTHRQPIELDGRNEFPELGESHGSRREGVTEGMRVELPGLLS